MYTEQDVFDAYFAHKCDKEAKDGGTTGELIALQYNPEYSMRAEYNHYQRGLEILSAARLHVPQRLATCDETRVSDDAPVVLVSVSYYGETVHFQWATLVSQATLDSMSVEERATILVGDEYETRQ